MLSFRGAGIAREPGTQEHGLERTMVWPVFVGSGPDPGGPSRNDTRFFQHPARRFSRCEVTSPRLRQGCPGNERRLRNWSQTRPSLVMAVLDTAIRAFRPRTVLRGWP